MSNIDFDNLTTDQSDKISKAVKVVTEYIAERKAVGESIKITLDDLVSEMEADKESAKRLKKTVKKAASLVANNKTGELLDDNSALELLLKKMGAI